MTNRPTEYENLISLGYFHNITPEPGYKQQYLKVAQDYLIDSSQTNTAVTRYLLGYEAFYQVVQAMLEHFAVRATDRQGHRTIAIQRVSADLGLTPGEIKLISLFHNRRNEYIYRAPLPPVSEQEAQAMVELANKAVTAAVALMQKEPKDPPCSPRPATN